MSFDEKVYEVIENIPEGRVSTYKVIAERLDTEAYRAIGQALKRNPDAPTVPCHRVVSSDGTIGGYMGEETGESVQKKIRLLQEEGVEIEDGEIKNFEDVLWT